MIFKQHPLDFYTYNKPLLQVYGRVMIKTDDMICINNHHDTLDESTIKRGSWEIVLRRPEHVSYNRDYWKEIELKKIYRFSFIEKLVIKGDNRIALEGWFIDAEDAEKEIEQRKANN